MDDLARRRGLPLVVINAGQSRKVKVCDFRPRRLVRREPGVVIPFPVRGNGD